MRSGFAALRVIYRLPAAYAINTSGARIHPEAIFATAFFSIKIVGPAPTITGPNPVKTVSANNAFCPLTTDPPPPIGWYVAVSRVIATIIVRPGTIIIWPVAVIRAIAVIGAITANPDMYADFSFGWFWRLKRENRD